MRVLRPDTLITWPPDGLSGHPDHVAVSEWTRLAFEATQTMGVGAPRALYYMAVPEEVAAALGFSGLHTVPDEAVTLAVDVIPVWEQKLRAIRCHRTQAGESPILRAPEERQRLFLGTEYFRRGVGRSDQDVLRATGRSQT